MAAKHRPIEDIARDIAGAKEWLSGLVREKLSAERSARMKIQRHTPEFIAKMNAGLATVALDPERRAQTSAKKSANAFRRPRILPPMSDRQTRFYKKLRSGGVARWEAVEAALHLEAQQ